MCSQASSTPPLGLSSHRAHHVAVTVIVFLPLLLVTLSLVPVLAILAALPGRADHAYALIAWLTLWTLSILTAHVP